jgi:hypothetical protein
MPAATHVSVSEYLSTILLKDDTLSSVRSRLDDFLRMGVQYVWLIDPEERRG